VNGVVLLLSAGLLWSWFRLKKEIRLRKLADASLRQLAYNDALTGIPNRNSFIPYANRQLLSANRTDQKIALCFFDLNAFKAINDDFGHRAGDAVLVHVANAITSIIRGSDMAARIGGDEFAVLLSGIHNVEDTRRTIHEIQQAIAKPFQFEGQSLSITASVGVAIYPEECQQIDELMSKADTAMYNDKWRRRVHKNNPIPFSVDAIR
jgi:diguanylate cyclase (GGDEF)-like protein